LTKSRACQKLATRPKLLPRLPADCGARGGAAMEEQTIKLKLQPLTPEAFKPYGQVLENRQPVLPEVEPGEGRVAIELLKFKRPTNARRISMMATHFSYNQTFIPCAGRWRWS